MSDSKTKVFNAQEAVHELQKAIEDIRMCVAALGGAVRTIEALLFEVVYWMVPSEDRFELRNLLRELKENASIKANDLLGTDEGQE